MIIKWLGWQNNLTDGYVTNPPAGKKRNEFEFTSGLHVSFLTEIFSRRDSAEA